MSSRRVLVLMNDYTAPPNAIPASQVNRDNDPWVMQYDVISCLKKLNYEVLPLGLSNDIRPLQDSIKSFKPDVVFNLLLEFAGQTIFDQNVVSYLELLGVPYTGSNPRSLSLARNKSTAKKILRYHDILTPDFFVFPRGHAISMPAQVSFPLIVKCVSEDASLGISMCSVVHNEKKLEERVETLHRSYDNDAIVEQFIEGRELSIGILGNERLTAFPVWELLFEKSEAPKLEFYHCYAKWNTAYRKRKGIRSQRAELPRHLEQSVARIGKKVYRALDLQGYARIDFRMAPSGDIYVIEANPNPDICVDEDFSMAAKATGLEYTDLLRRIVSLGLNHPYIR